MRYFPSRRNWYGVLFLVYVLLGMSKTLTCREQRHKGTLRISIENEPKKIWECGELLSNRPEDQEIAVLSFHLIQVSLALVNTLMLQEVLAEEK